eukprot:GEMP01078497.1.p1 GENE.GEMP01078497.1~~GEMP01078497.1.p1  ORF type:complete len:117 (+),score=21.94 GEMP01078497.1:113-463(+)
MASSPDNDFLRQPPYGPGPSNFVPKHRASCYCKTVIYEVDTDPLDVKVSCSRCRSPIADEGRRMWLGFLPTFDFSRGSIPDSFRVKKHINYGAHVIDVDDSAPTFPGMPPSCHVGS